MDAYQNWIAALSDTFNRFLATSASFVPSLVGAVVLLVAGWVLAWLVRALIVRVAARLDGWISPVRDRAMQAGIQLRWSISTIIAQFVYWLIILFFITAAAAVLRLPGLVDWLDRLIQYVPAIFAAALIILLGYLISGVVGRLTAAAASSAGYARAEFLGRVAGGLTLTFAVILGVGQLGLDITLLENLVSIAAAALLGGAALAFGIGAGTAVGNIMAAHYVHRVYSVGQAVRVGEFEGRILEFTPTAVILETAQGRVMVPAKLFNEAASLLIEPVHAERSE